MDAIEKVKNKIEYLEQRIHSLSSSLDLSADIETVFETCKRIKWAEGVARATVLFAYYQTAKGNYIDAEKLYHSAKQLSLREKLPYTTLDCDYGQSVVFHRQGKLKDSYSLIKGVLHQSQIINYPYRKAFSNLQLGILSNFFSYDNEALIYYKEALALSYRHGFIKLSAITLDELSGLLLTKQNYAVAEQYARKAILVNKQLDHKSDTIKSQIRLLTIFLAKEDYKKANSKLSQLKRQIDDVALPTRGTLFLCEARLSWKQKKYLQAKSYYSQALTIFKNASRVRLVANTYQQQCEMYLSLKDDKFSVKYATLALVSAKKSQDDFLIAESYNLLYESYRLARNSKQSLNYLEKYNETRKSNDLDLLNKRLEFIELKTEYEKQQAEIDEEKKKAEMLRLELEQKERELTEKTRHLIKQTEAVAQFRDDLRAILRRTPSDDPLVKDVKERLKLFPEEQLNWIEFDKLFDSVHPEFYSNIVKAFPKLTIMERKICILLRLKLTSTDISKLMFLSDRNIENHRYRIRKKLGLNTEESIHEFLAKF